MNALGDAVVRCGEANWWAGAAAAMLFWDLYGAAMPAVRIVLTLHNMDSTGECSQEEFAFTGAFTPAYSWLPARSFFGIVQKRSLRVPDSDRCV